MTYFTKLGPALKMVMAMAVFAAALSATPVAAADKIKIGFLTTMSGALAALGKRHYDGFLLAMEMRGYKVGGRDAEVVTADDQGVPDVGVQQVRKLLARDKVDLMTGVIFSNVMMAVYKPVVENKTFFIQSFAAPSPLSGKLCNPYLFSTALQNDMTYEAMGQYLTDSGVKQAFILGPNYQGGRDALAGFKRYFKGEVVAEVYTKLNQPDYATELSRIRAQRPEAVYVFYPGGMGINFVKQYSGAGLLGKIPLYSTFTVEETTIRAMGDAAVGAYSSAVYNDDLDNPENKKFTDAFRKKYKRRPSIFAATGYDAATFLDIAAKAANADFSNKDEIRAALKKAQPRLTRGPFRFNTNQFPIENFYLTQAVKEKGELRMKTVRTIFKMHKDSYSHLCKMK